MKIYHPPVAGGSFAASLGSIHSREVILDFPIIGTIRRMSWLVWDSDA